MSTAASSGDDEREQDRLSALARYEILDTPADGAFDRVTQLLSQLLDVPIAVVSLVDRDRIWFKSHHGLDVDQVDRAPGLCASAVLGDGLYVVNDAATDPRTLTNPLVAGDLGLGFYAGYPLRTKGGHNLGMLCALDVAPRELSPRDELVLETLAGLVMDQMELRLAAREVDRLHADLQNAHEELREQAARDDLTGLWNRAAILELTDRAVARSRRTGLPPAVLILDIDHFKTINDTHGHPVGDQVLVEFSLRVVDAVRTSDAVGRLGGEEFICVLDACPAEQAEQVAEKIRTAICSQPFLASRAECPVELGVTTSIGVFAMDHDQAAEPEDVIRQADDALYKSKTRGRNQVTTHRSISSTEPPVTTGAGPAGPAGQNRRDDRQPVT